MKVKSLWVSKYKNIEDLTFEFNSELISLLIGMNGLGKSNLIEILALIFRDLDLLNSKEAFENWAYDPEYFEYEIHYECRAYDLIIICKESQFSVKIKDLDKDNDFAQLDLTNFIKDKSDKYLPKYVIGYYSGENDRIRKIIRPYEEEVWKDLRRNKGLEKGLRRFFFAEDLHAQLVLLTLQTYSEKNPNEEFRKRAENLIKNFTSFNGIKQLDIKLESPKWYKPGNKTHMLQGVDQLEENLLKDSNSPHFQEFPFWNTKGKASKMISYLYHKQEKAPRYYNETVKDIDGKSTVKEFLVLDSIKVSELANKANEEIGDALSFFDALESLLLIESLNELVLQVNSKVEGVSFEFSHLSEGERQIITVLGLVLIAGQEDCLFLLDEPDTHLNPNWQRGYIQLLEAFNLNDDNSHIIVASHSPLLIQSSERTDTFLFLKDKDGRVIVDSENHAIRNWRIDQVYESEYFNISNTRPTYTDKFMEEREKLLSKPKLNEDDIARLKQLENEYGVFPTGETFNDMKALNLIRNILEEASNNDKDQ